MARIGRRKPGAWRKEYNEKSRKRQNEWMKQHRRKNPEKWKAYQLSVFFKEMGGNPMVNNKVSLCQK